MRVLEKSVSVWYRTTRAGERNMEFYRIGCRTQGYRRTQSEWRIVEDTIIWLSFWGNSEKVPSRTILGVQKPLKSVQSTKELNVNLLTGEKKIRNNNLECVMHTQPVNATYTLRVLQGFFQGFLGILSATETQRLNTLFQGCTQNFKGSPKVLIAINNFTVKVVADCQTSENPSCRGFIMLLQ